MKDIPGGQPHLPQIMAQEQGETMDLLVFLVARVPRRDLSLLKRIHVVLTILQRC